MEGAQATGRTRRRSRGNGRRSYAGRQPVQIGSPWGSYDPPWHGGDDAMAALQAMLSASERRTMEALVTLQEDMRDMREEMRGMGETYMPADRVVDRWRTQDQSDTRQDRAITELQQGHSQLLTAMQRLPTRDDISDMLKTALREHPTTSTVQTLIASEVTERTKAHVTAAEVQQLLSTARQGRWDEWKNTIGWLVLVLGFLMAAGIIHPAALFGH